MANDHTKDQYDQTIDQSNEDERRSRQLSLHRTQPPAQIPGYEIKRFLGSGAYGEVWIGLDLNTGRMVAIKFFIHRGGVDWSLLSREVEKLVFLSADRYVVQLLDVGWESEPPYYVMEYVENGSLDDFLNEHERMTLEQAVEMFREIAIGLVHAHSKGVLHCDLKPANILLDQDRRPRLADFGQSRLSHEQTPSLGTLFYMAPEQAQLDAVPDARWDVYALGAILYCVLTGSPPHRSVDSLREIDTAGSLKNRLDRYRYLLADSPPPDEHMKLPGMDRSMCQIIDRCLAVDPDKRYPNAQEILNALDERDRQRSRRPLLLLGIVVPLVLVCAMVAFGFYFFSETVTEAQETVARRVQESNVWIADHVANRIENEFERYFEIIEKESSNLALQLHLQQVLQNPKVVASTRAGIPMGDRDEFMDATERLRLRDHLAARLQDYLSRADEDPDEPRFASMFVIAPNGTMLAVAYDRVVKTKSVGKNFSYRTYFHGQAVELPKGELHHDVPPLEQTHLSAVFRSTTTNIWKIAVSTPIIGNKNGKQTVLGVVAVTVNLGDFPFIRSENQAHRFAVLVDGRAGPRRGTILQHPLFDGKDVVSKDYNRSDYQVKEDVLRGLKDGKQLTYNDPLSLAEDGVAYQGEWIGGLAGVSLPERLESNDGIPELIVLVQENHAFAIAPLYTFRRLIRDGIIAIVFVIGAVGLTWLFVARSYQHVVNRIGGQLSTLGSDEPA